MTSARLPLARVPLPRAPLLRAPLPRAPPLAPSLSLPLADVPVLAATISTLTSPVALEATAGALSVLVLLSQLSSDPGPAWTNSLPRAGCSRPPSGDFPKVIEPSPRERTIRSDGGVLLPGAQLAAWHLTGRGPSHPDRPRRVRPLGAVPTATVCGREQKGDTAAQGHTRG